MYYIKTEDSTTFKVLLLFSEVSSKFQNNT
jgi:hypothetical protein